LQMVSEIIEKKEADRKSKLQWLLKIYGTLLIIIILIVLAYLSAESAF